MTRRTPANLQGSAGRCGRVAALALLVCLIVSLIGCAARPDESAPNVVIVLMDTLRADWLSTYGHSAATSPRIDALALRSVVFEAASSPAPWTLPSVVSIFTSTLLTEHGVSIDGQKLDDGLPSLAEILADRGYVTASFVENAFGGEASGLDRGFDTYLRAGQPEHAVAVRDWIRGRPDQPFFLYVHSAITHAQSASDAAIATFAPVPRETREHIVRLVSRYRSLTRADFMDHLPPGTRDNSSEQSALLAELGKLEAAYAAIYSGAVLDADAFVGSIIDELRESDAWQRTLFIFLSDHGEEFGEHGGWLHDQSLYQELVHVPLIVRFPGDAYAGLRVERPVSLIDVAPTISDVIGSEPAASMRGRSLMPLIEGGAAAEAPRVTAIRNNAKKFYRPFKESRGDVNVVVRDGDWKAIYNAEQDATELYDLSRDPGERTDLSDLHPKRTQQLRELAVSALGAESAASQPGGLRELDAGTLEALRELGYVDAEEPAPEQP